MTAEQVDKRNQKANDALEARVSAAAWLLTAIGSTAIGVLGLVPAARQTFYEAFKLKLDDSQSLWIGAIGVGLTVGSSLLTVNRSRKAVALDAETNALAQGAAEVRAVGVASVPNLMTQTTIVENAPGQSYSTLLVVHKKR